MKDHELVAILNQGVNDAVIFNSQFMADNEKALKYYLGEAFGDEVEGRSQVVSTDVADVVEADMPSLARVFLGPSDIVKFQPNTLDEREVQEAEDKTKYVDWLVRHQPDSFKKLHDWMKDAEIQKMGVLKYMFSDKETVEEHEYRGISELNLVEIVSDLKRDKNVKLEVVSHTDNGDETLDVTFKTTRTEQKIEIIPVATESFLISRNATCKNTAEIVGDRIRKTRSELLADGFDRELVDKLPTIETDTGSDTSLKQIRFDQEGGEARDSSINDWANELVEVYDLYPLIDFDGDGIVERRHVLMAGNKILENDPFDHVPYAILSAILMPHKAIGRSRAEVTMQTQRIKSVMLRQTLDNMYMVNNGRNIVDENTVNIDDMLTVRPNGIVRNDGPVGNSALPLVTPYVGDKALQVIQYMDQARAQTTGSLLASQGLDADAIGKETATRFRGIEEAGTAKIELIARNYAETGFRDLYEGVAWLVSKYQTTETEFRVLGRGLTVDPKGWRYNHHVKTQVGLGAGDNDEMVSSMTALFTIHQQLQASGSPLSDQKKIYNILDKITKGLELPDVSMFFNDPEKPDDLLLAENEMLTKMVQQLQGQLEQSQNPLLQPAVIGAQAKMAEVERKIELDAAKAMEDARQFNVKTKQEAEQFQQDKAIELTKLELENQKDVPGALV